MKFSTHCTILISLTIFLFSCTDEDVTMLYHPEKEAKSYWLLEHVDYPEEKLGILFPKDFTLSYNDNDSLKAIDVSGSEPITINYSDKTVSLSKLKKSGTTIVYDSILVHLNNNRHAEYILHRSYTQRDSETNISKYKSIDDSLALYYNTEGYLIQLESYGTTGKPSSLRLTEKYKIENGNITEILSTKHNTPTYRYTYMYDNTEHILPVEYCHEMPYNTMTLSTNGCWLMDNLPFVSKFLGKKSKNNIIQTIIKQIGEKEESNVYADIKYDYTYNDNNMVSKVKILGTVNNKLVTDDYTIAFSYLEKAKKE